MPPHPSIREIQYLRGTNEIESCNVWMLAGFAVASFLLAYVIHWLRMRQVWHAAAREKRVSDTEDELTTLELEAGRRYNIPVEYLRGVEIRVRK